MIRDKALQLLRVIEFSTLMQGGTEQERTDRGIKIILDAVGPDDSVALEKSELELQEAIREYQRLVAAPEGTFAQELIDQAELKLNEAELDMKVAKSKVGARCG